MNKNSSMAPRLCLAVLLFGLLPACTSLTNDLSYEIPASKLQARLDNKFPLETCRLGVFCLQISKGEVVLKEGSDRLGLRLQVKTSIGPVSKTGLAEVSSTLRYAPSTASLHADAIAIEHLSFDGLPQTVADAVKQTLPTLLQNELKTQALYVLQTETLSDKMAKASIKDIRVTNGKLRVQLGFP